MGAGSYSSTTRAVRADTMGYATKSATEIFSKTINNAMDPHGLVVRESRDSEEHPESMAIFLGLDVTGSMGSVPHYLVKEGLPHMMDGILEAGLDHPQVLFVAIGDHTCDQAPLQVGQYESSDELLDHWLTNVWLEGHGGGNEGESYLLAWYLAAFHTEIDCLEKRGHKGILITVGDEPCLTDVDRDALARIMGPGQYSGMTSEELLAAARQKYDVFHIHLTETRAGSTPGVLESWQNLLGRENVIVANRSREIPEMIRNQTIAACVAQGLSGVRIIRTD